MDRRVISPGAANDLAMQQSIMGNPNFARRATLRNRKDRGGHKPRRAWLVARAIFRLKVMTRPRLVGFERELLSRNFLAVGAMRDVHQVSELLSNLGIGIGYEEMERFLLQEAWFVPGKVLEWRQFLLLVKYLKRKFLRDQAVPPSHIAFVALGGEPDLSGDIDADDLRGVCQRFALTLDIDAFMAEHDDDGSGRLEIGEFSALFQEDGDGGDGRGNDANGSQDVRRDSVLHMDDEKAPDILIADKIAPKQEPAQDKQQELTPQVVFAECDAWIRSNPLPILAKDPGSPGSPSSPVSDGGANQSKSRRNRNQDLPASFGSSTEDAHRRPLWAPRDPADTPAKEVLKRKVGVTQQGASFGTSRRFDFDRVVAPLPAPPKVAKGSEGSQSARLPAVKHSSRWYDQNPFDAPQNAAADREPHYQAPRNMTTPRGENTTPKLPIIVRNAKGQSVIVQPDFVF